MASKEILPFSLRRFPIPKQQEVRVIAVGVLEPGSSETKYNESRNGLFKNKAGYTAQDAPSMRSFHLRK